MFFQLIVVPTATLTGPLVTSAGKVHLLVVADMSISSVFAATIEAVVF
jgi:hypothetical protein